MVEVIQVDPDLVGENHLVIKANGIFLLGEQALFVRVLERRRARDSRSQGQDPPVGPPEPVVIPRDVRARPHETDIASQDIPKLGKLVQLVTAEKAAEGRDPAVSPDGHRRRIGMVNGHGPEFPEDEAPAVPADPFLPEKHRPRGGHLDENGDDPHGDGQDQEAVQGECRIKRPLPRAHIHGLILRPGPDNVGRDHGRGAQNLCYPASKQQVNGLFVGKKVRAHE